MGRGCCDVAPVGIQAFCWPGPRDLATTYTCLHQMRSVCAAYKETPPSLATQQLSIASVPVPFSLPHGFAPVCLTGSMPTCLLLFLSLGAHSSSPNKPLLHQVLLAWRNFSRFCLGTGLAVGSSVSASFIVKYNLPR